MSARALRWRALMLGLVMLVGGPPCAAEAAAWTQEIEMAAARAGLAPELVRAVMMAESAGDPAAVSAAGARGLMQIMPGTWRMLQARLGLGPDPFHPADNLLAGAVYLRELRDRFGAPGFLAAYNAGPARYASHLANGRPLPPETRAYLVKLGPIASRGAELFRPWTHAPLFPAIAPPASAAAVVPAETME